MTAHTPGKSPSDKWAAKSRAAAALRAQVWASAPGTVLTYHEGYLAEDRQCAGAEAGLIDCIGHMAWALYEEGAVTLTQRHHADGSHDYLAIVRGRP